NAGAIDQNIDPAIRLGGSADRRFAGPLHSNIAGAGQNAQRLEPVEVRAGKRQHGHPPSFAQESTATSRPYPRRAAGNEDETSVCLHWIWRSEGTTQCDLPDSPYDGC